MRAWMRWLLCNESVHFWWCLWFVVEELPHFHKWRLMLMIRLLDLLITCRSRLRLGRFLHTFDSNAVTLGVVDDAVVIQEVYWFLEQLLTALKLLLLGLLLHEFLLLLELLLVGSFLFIKCHVCFVHLSLLHCRVVPIWRASSLNLLSTHLLTHNTLVVGCLLFI